MFEINLNFQNWSKALCLGVSEPTKRLAAQSTAYTLCNRRDKQTFVKESKKKKSKSVKSLRYKDEFFFTRLMSFQYLKFVYNYVSYI